MLMKSYIMISVGVLFLLWFAAPYFTKRILNAGNGVGLSLSGLLLLCGLTYEKLPALSGNMQKTSYGRTLLSFAFLLGIVLLTYVMVNTICIVAAIIKKASPPCTLIVLGCKVYGTKASLMLEERLQAALRFMKKHPEVPCVVSGGKGDDEDISEAECMYQYLVDAGIPDERIYLEGKSKNTGENITFSMELIRREGLCPQLALVSNEFHIYRATKIARHLGFSARGVPARTAWWLFPTYFVRELLCIANEWLRQYKY